MERGGFKVAKGRRVVFGGDVLGKGNIGNSVIGLFWRPGQVHRHHNAGV